MSNSSNENTRRDFIGATGAAMGLAALASAFTGNSAEGAEVMEVNAMRPTPEQVKAFLALPEKPVVMVNLLKIKDASEYQKYGMGVSKLLADIGAEVIFRGQCQNTFVGGTEWDMFALVRYPSPQAALKMFSLPEYQAIHVHRDAGLAGQILMPVFES